MQALYSASLIRNQWREVEDLPLVVGVRAGVQVVLGRQAARHSRGQ